VIVVSSQTAMAGLMPARLEVILGMSNMREAADDLIRNIFSPHH